MVFVDHVVPAMKYHSKNIIADRSRLMTEVQSNADSNRNTDNEITYDISKRAVVTLDGELPHIECIMKSLVQIQDDHIEYFKFSAACSSCQQPNDKMRSFKILKMATKAMQYDETVTK